MGRYVGVGEETPAVQVLDEILAGAGCYLITDRLGRVSIGRFDAPSTTPDFELTSEQIVSLSRVALPYASPPYRWSIGHKRNYRVMTDTELADAVEEDEDDVRLLTTEQSTSTADDTTISTAHPKSSEQFLSSTFQRAGEARTEARRLLTVYSKNRRAFEIRVAGVGRYNRLADTCKVTFNRHGLSSGQNFRVTAVTEDYGRNLTTLRLFG